MKHTKEKWIMTTDGDANFCGIATENRWLMRIQQNGELLPNEQKANAKLIAAAPEQQNASILLYNLCKQLANMIDYSNFESIRSEWNKAMNAHEQAIKKAIQ